MGFQSDCREEGAAQVRLLLPPTILQMDNGEETYHITGRLKPRPGVTHTRFWCQLVVRKGMVVKAGPTLAMMVGWSLSRVESYIATKESLKLHTGGI